MATRAATASAVAAPATLPRVAETPAPPISTAAGSFDGSGADEAVSVYSDPLAGWRIAFQLHGRTRIEAGLSGFFDGCHGSTAGLYQPHVLGVGDFAASGRDLALVEVWHGASTGFAAIFGVDRGSITAATVVDGANACQRIFPFNGSVTHGNGLACHTVAGAAGLQVLQATAQSPTDQVSYQWYRANYQWRALDLHFISLEHSVMHVGDPGLHGAWEVHCPGIPINPY